MSHKKEFNLENYLSNGVEKIVKNAIKATLSNPKESLFMIRYAKASKKARKLRQEAKIRGEHIPPFLIASITSQCNLRCAGCYSRANHACFDEPLQGELTKEEWLRIFKEAAEMGIGFILLAGGEPMVRRDVLEIATQRKEILFPVFTNGTLLDESYLNLFDDNRNLVPVLSIEGNEEKTDQRRGDGIYNTLMESMHLLKEKGVVFGTSVTVTKENIQSVTSKEFLEELEERGSKVVFYIEFVPVTEEAKELAPEDAEREYLNQKLLELRETHTEMVFISFPGDEKTSGGCLAAGRGFFHINAQGGAEPCPFSPYSDRNLKTMTLKEALESPLFMALQKEELLMEDHAGGCVLFERREEVESILNR